MEQVKALFKNKKFLRIFIPVVVILVALGGFAYTRLSDESVGVELGTVEYGTVQQFYDTTGTLASGSSEKYYLYEGVVVKEVNVKTGDAVSKGDVLATFDTSSMNSIISEKSRALTNAKNTYNDAVASRNDTAARAAEIDSEIAALQEQKAALEKAQADNAASGTTNGTELSDEQIQAIIAALANGNNGGATGETQLTDAQIAAIVAQLQNSNAANPQAMTSVQAIDTQIAILESEKSMTNSGQYDTVIDAYKRAMDTAQAEYSTAVAEKKALDAGWVASADGKVADVHIKAGEAYVYVEDTDGSGDMLSMLMGSSAGSSSEITDMLSGVISSSSGSTARQGLGMVVDYYDGYKVTFNLGKYDAQTIQVGMPAFVSYTDYEYEAEVSYISPYAESGASAITTMMGSSSTTSSALPAEATITNSDNNLIIGFDAKLSILVAEHKDVLKLPVEALIIEEGVKYVYIYDEATSTAVKTEVETGVSSESHYEVLDGLSEGDRVIMNASKVTDGITVYVEE